MNEKKIEEFKNKKITVNCIVRNKPNKSLTVPGKTVIDGRRAAENWGLVNTLRMIAKNHLIVEGDDDAAKKIKFTKDKQEKLEKKVAKEKALNDKKDLDL